MSEVRSSEDESMSEGEDSSDDTVTSDDDNDDEDRGGFNTDPSTKPGEHWVAYHQVDGHAEFSTASVTHQ